MAPDERRYTIMVVPEQGRGVVRQLAVTQRHIRWLALGGVCAMALLAVGLIQPLGLRAVEAENRQLKTQLSALESAVGQAEAELERLKQAEAQLTGLDGYGPLDDDEAAAAGVVAERGRIERRGESGAPMDDVDALLGRTARLLTALHRTGPILKQRFDQAYARLAHTPSIWPVQGMLSSGFGVRRSPITHRLKLHSGIDVAAPRGTPIHASAAGTVIHAGYTSGYGNLIELDHANGVITRYAHSSRLMVDIGDEVQRGETIATVGSTGQSTGPHLHYEVLIDGLAVDPMDYIPGETAP